MRIRPDGSIMTDSPGQDSSRRSASRRSRNGRRFRRGPASSTQDPKSWRLRSARVLVETTPQPSLVRSIRRSCTHTRWPSEVSLDVALQAVGTLREGQLVGGQGVLRPVRAGTSVGDHQSGRPGTSHSMPAVRLTRALGGRPRLGSAVGRESTPGFSSPSGSTVALMARIQSICSGRPSQVELVALKPADPVLGADAAPDGRQPRRQPAAQSPRTPPPAARAGSRRGRGRRMRSGERQRPDWSRAPHRLGPPTRPLAQGAPTARCRLTG